MIIRTIGDGNTDYPDGVKYFSLRQELRAAHFGTVSKTKTLYGLHGDNGEAIGICGAIWFSRTCRFTNAYVMVEHRGRGGYRMMMEYRIAEARSRGIRWIESCCTEMSLPEYLKRGAVPLHYYPRINQTRVRMIL